MIGVVAPGLWLVMAFATGLLGGAWRQIWSLGHGNRMTEPGEYAGGGFGIARCANDRGVRTALDEGV